MTLRPNLEIRVSFIEKELTAIVRAKVLKMNFYPSLYRSIIRRKVRQLQKTLK